MSAAIAWSDFLQTSGKWPASLTIPPRWPPMPSAQVLQAFSAAHGAPQPQPPDAAPSAGCSRSPSSRRRTSSVSCGSQRVAHYDHIAMKHLALALSIVAAALGLVRPGAAGKLRREVRHRSEQLRSFRPAAGRLLPVRQRRLARRGPRFRPITRASDPSSTCVTRRSATSALLIEDLAKGAKSPGSPAQQIGDLYVSYMDEATAETQGSAAARAGASEDRGRRVEGRSRAPHRRARRVRRRRHEPRRRHRIRSSRRRRPSRWARVGITLLPDRDYYLKDDPQARGRAGAVHRVSRTDLHADRRAGSRRRREGGDGARNRGREGAVAGGGSPRRR